MEIMTRISYEFSSQMSWPGFPCFSYTSAKIATRSKDFIDIENMDISFYKQAEPVAVCTKPERATCTFTCDSNGNIDSEVYAQEISKASTIKSIHYTTWNERRLERRKRKSKRCKKTFGNNNPAAKQFTDICNFNYSLLPRTSKPDDISDKEEYEIFDQAFNDISVLEQKAAQFLKHDSLVRPCKKNKKQKTQNQIKDKYCKDISNVYHGKKLFMHYRLYKNLVLSQRIPKTKYTVINANGQMISNAGSNETKMTNDTEVKPKVTPTTQYVLQESNAASDIDSLALIAFLMEIQNRDITPEDYEQLLLLDDRVKKQTVSKCRLNAFQADYVTEANTGNLCAICLEEYELGQVLKILPVCQHSFHENCVITWLSQEGATCPLDGLAVS